MRADPADLGHVRKRGLLDELLQIVAADWGSGAPVAVVPVPVGARGRPWSWGCGRTRRAPALVAALCAARPRPAPEPPLLRCCHRHAHRRRPHECRARGRDYLCSSHGSLLTRGWLHANAGAAGIADAAGRPATCVHWTISALALMLHSSACTPRRSLSGNGASSAATAHVPDTWARARARARCVVATAPQGRCGHIQHREGLGSRDHSSPTSRPRESRPWNGPLTRTASRSPLPTARPTCVRRGLPMALCGWRALGRRAICTRPTRQRSRAGRTDQGVDPSWPPTSGRRASRCDRMGSAPTCPPRPSLEQIRRRPRRLQPRRRGSGVRIQLEVHGPDTSHIPAIHRILQHAGEAPALWVCWNSNQTDLKTAGSTRTSASCNTASARCTCATSTSTNTHGDNWCSCSGQRASTAIATPSSGNRPAMVCAAQYFKAMFRALEGGGEGEHV